MHIPRHATLLQRVKKEKEKGGRRVKKRKKGKKVVVREKKENVANGAAFCRQTSNANWH